MEGLRATELARPQFVRACPVGRPLRAAGEHSHLLAGPKTQAASDVAGPRDVTVSREQGNGSRVAELGGRAPYDEDVFKNKDILNRRLNRTIRSDHHHGPDTMSRCAYELVGSG